MSKTKKTFKLTLPVAPVPASRPRVGKWGTFYSKNYAKWKKDADVCLKEITAKNLELTIRPLQIEGAIAVTIEQICKRPKKLTREYPRGDLDNHAKGPLDAITQSDIGWHDDDQVTKLIVSKRYAEPDEEPRSIIIWKAI